MNNTGYTYSDCLYVFYGSVEELEEQNRISIYPNPSTGQFTIESEEGKLIENIQIHSTDGRLIYTHENLKKSKAEMHLEHLPKGIYFLKAKIGSELVHDKIVIE